jgi:uncharacterized membrane protein
VSNPYDIIQKADIETAIKAAEIDTSGEIRVHIEERCPEEVLDRAAFVFSELEMQTTALRNGVLIYLSLADHKFAIIGDAGINAKVPANFWESTAELMKLHFSKREITQGICAGIIEAGKQLKNYFPYHAADKNELSNEVTFGNPTAS